MKQAEPHKHNFTKLDFIREVGARGGNTIDRIILGRRCSCEKFEAFEMGGKQEMRDLYKRLVMEGKRNANRSVQGREGGVAGKGQTNRPRTAQA